MSDIIEFTVSGQRLRTDTMNVHTFAEGSMESVILQFHLSGSWSGYTTFAHFKQDDRFFDEILRTIDGTDNCCYLPIRIKDGYCSLSLYGRNDNRQVLTTNCLMLHIKSNGIVSESFEFPQSVAEHIVTMFIQASDSGNIAIARDTENWDVDKIYIYLGDDPEYKTGYWYYYDGDEWAQGGSYTSEVLHVGDGLILDDTGTASVDIGNGLVISNNKVSVDIGEGLAFDGNHLKVTDNDGPIAAIKEKTDLLANDDGDAKFTGDVYSTVGGTEKKLATEESVDDVAERVDDLESKTGILTNDDGDAKFSGDVYANGDKKLATEETVREMSDGANVTPENVLDLSVDEVHSGFYDTTGKLNTNAWDYVHTFIPCSPGDVFYTNISIGTSLTITFFDAERQFVSYFSFHTNDKIVVPNIGDIKYMSIPLQYSTMALYVVSKTPITDKYINGTLSGTNGVAYTEFYKKLSVNGVFANSGDCTIDVSSYKNTAKITKKDTVANNYWCAFTTNIINATVYGTVGALLVLAYRGSSIVCYNFANGEVIRLSTDNTTGSYTILGTYPLEQTVIRNGTVYNISYGSTVTITSLSDGNQVRIPLYRHIDSGYRISFGYAWRNVTSTIGRVYRVYVDCTSITGEPIMLTHNQWEGKKWYAYGTSITNIDREGKYAKYLRDFSGMQLTNKGISGGGIGDLGGYSHGQVYEAICNVTDGKLEADIITLETGANDTGATVPYGTIYDTGRATLAGCLNDCLRYLQANTDAQIVVIQSPVTTTKPNAANKFHEWAFMVEQICKINRVHFISSNNNMGYGKLTSESGSSYVVDAIHQTELGGYVFAENVWYQLKNIPVFRKELK